MSQNNEYSVHVLFDGYSCMNECGTEMKANCTCTLIKGPINILVDTMTAWDRDKIIKALIDYNLTPDDINYIVCTHGHSDHIGNNNLFLKAKHILGFSISFQNIYYIHPFEEGKVYDIDDYIKVFPTPGHTMSDVTLVVKTSTQVYAITGDLFERYEDIDNQRLWIDAGSESIQLQKKHRLSISQLADWIVPGHGPAFKCTPEIRNLLESQLGDV